MEQLLKQISSKRTDILLANLLEEEQELKQIDAEANKLRSILKKLCSPDALKVFFQLDCLTGRKEAILLEYIYEKGLVEGASLQRELCDKKKEDLKTSA